METDFEDKQAFDIKPSIKLEKSENSKGDVYYSWSIRIAGITDEDLKRLKEINNKMVLDYPRESANGN